jgi:hypothetical protein
MLHFLKVNPNDLSVINRITIQYTHYYFIPRAMKLIDDNKMHFIFTIYYVANNAGANYDPSHYYGFLDFSVSLTDLYII